MDWRKEQPLMTDKELENKTEYTANNRTDAEAVEVYSEKAETRLPEMSEDEIRAAALAYAIYLKKHDLKPGDASFVEPEAIGAKVAEAEYRAPVSAGRQSGSASVNRQSGPAAVNDQNVAAAVRNRNGAAPATGQSAPASVSRQAAPAAANRQNGAAPVRNQNGAAPATGQSAPASVNRQAAQTAVNRKNGAAPVRNQKGAAPAAGQSAPASVSRQAAPAAANRQNGAAPVRNQNGAAPVNRQNASASAANRGASDPVMKQSEPVHNAYQKRPPTVISKSRPAPVIDTREPVIKLDQISVDLQNTAGPDADRVVSGGKQAKEKADKKAKESKRAKYRKKKAKKKKSDNNKDIKYQFLHTKVSSRGLPSLITMHDAIQDRSDEVLSEMGKSFAKGAHDIASSYSYSRRTMGVGLLIVGILVAVVLMVFDRFTLYEYAYNGKVLGYVHEQEEVTEILDIAGDKLSQNNRSEGDVEFSANQNVTFNLVDARGKTADDADTAVNKFIYMTDIETEAYAVYDGDRIVAVVKDKDEAENLLKETKSELSQPDSGMELLSADFTNKLDIKPINVLLSSVQSRSVARYQMVHGAKMEIWHIVEENETLTSLAKEFGVDPISIFDENNETVTSVDQGDKVCIRTTVDPVSVEMVESGKIKEIVEYETIKKKSDEYYKGDTHLEQEGVNGVQIFEGTLTKVGGEITDRDEIKTEVIKKKQDKIILVGTAERPKTAPTGTFAMPIETYVVTSEFGGRWGRMHEGMDFGASTGTPIYASDGGEIITSGIYGGYGYCINIDHGNGKLTRYGHCSKLLVNVGDRVYQGQLIALVGNTGHSFGSHLHFEIRENGTPVNPRKYINP